MSKIKKGGICQGLINTQHINTYASRIKDTYPCVECCNVRYVVIATHSGVTNAITALLTVAPLKYHMQKGHNKL